MLTNNTQQKKAVIFDMDGVVSDTQKFHVEIESKLLKDFGIEMAPGEITKRYAGVPDKLVAARGHSKADLIQKISSNQLLVTIQGCCAIKPLSFASTSPDNLEESFGSVLPPICPNHL
jgi:phosphoglycolate phosphatase-like HAD superfamily hydrolase